MSKRDYKTGGLRERSAGSWELKVRTVDPKTGKHIIKYYSFRGARSDAKRRLTELMNLASAGNLPDEKKTLGMLLDTWESTLDVSAKTKERYGELVRLYIRPHLGGLTVRAISASRLENFYGDLRTGKRPNDAPGGPQLAPRTIGHVHRILTQVLSLAERDRLIESNPARHAKRPKIAPTEIEILTEQQVRDVLDKLRGRHMRRICALGLATGMRRGELLALRWKDIDLDGGMVHVAQSLEQTKAGLQFKAPKTKTSRRQISIPGSIVAEIRSHKREQMEARLAAGLGRDADDALVFRRADGAPVPPDSLSTEWRRLVSTLKLPKVTMHAWRHTHASQMIAAGLDVVSISRRLGHSSPKVTLGVYAHLFRPVDDRAAAVFEAAFSGSFGENVCEPTRTK